MGWRREDLFERIFFGQCWWGQIRGGNIWVWVWAFGQEGSWLPLCSPMLPYCQWPSGRSHLHPFVSQSFLLTPTWPASPSLPIPSACQEFLDNFATADSAVHNQLPFWRAPTGASFRSAVPLAIHSAPNAIILTQGPGSLRWLQCNSNPLSQHNSHNVSERTHVPRSSSLTAHTDSMKNIKYDEQDFDELVVCTSFSRSTPYLILYFLFIKSFVV